MDADRLRLILLFAGMTLVVAIYLWDRYKRSRQRLKGLSLRQARKIRKEYGLDSIDEGESLPSFSAVEQKPEPEVSLKVVSPASPSPDPEPVLKLEPDSEPEPRPETQPELDFGANDQDDYLHVDPALQSDLPQMVVQIGLVKKEGAFRGSEIAQAMGAAGLEPGAMEIYHQHDARYPDRVLFSVASMVEPGYFPFDDMENFSTPGLLFFTQLPGVRDGMEIYSQMLYAANQIAGVLDGVLQDENRSVLSKQSIQHTRDAIAEHRRQLRLAQKMRHAN